MYKRAFALLGVVMLFGMCIAAPPMVDNYLNSNRADVAESRLVAAQDLAKDNLGSPREFATLPMAHYKVVNRLDGNTMVFAELAPLGDVYLLVDNVPASVNTSGVPFYKGPPI